MGRAPKAKQTVGAYQRTQKINGTWLADLIIFSVPNESKKGQVKPDKKGSEGFANNNFHFVLNILDEHSRFCVCLQPLRRKKAAVVAEHLLDAIANYGEPNELFTDQGPEFKGEVIDVCEARGMPT